MNFATRKEYEANISDALRTMAARVQELRALPALVPLDTDDLRMVHN